MILGGPEVRDIALITTSPPRKVIPENLSYDMLNRRHTECIGLVAHGPVHMALMCGFRSSLRQEVSNHIKAVINTDPSRRESYTRSIRERNPTESTAILACRLWN